ncbi:MAG: radical SAM protein [Fusobacteria bacterium]|nr:radical SAM protein [Fusobacteriota bacterium]
MKVLLVSPRTPETFWNFKHALSYIGKRAAFPPLGLLTVAAMAPSEWEKKLIDLNVERLKNSDIEWADIVFVTAMLIQTPSVKRIIKRVKEMGKTVVAGGPAFTTSQEIFDGVDHFVLNEAEVTFPLFIEDLKKGTLKQVYTSEEKPNLYDTPIPLWNLVDIQKYSTMSIQNSRGCPFNCEFCDIISMFGRIPRFKKPEQVVAELESLYVAGWRASVFIVDDNFIGHKIKVKELLREIIKWQELRNYPFKLLTEASINLAEDEELLTLMSRANFNKVFVGIETPDKNSLAECDKVQNMKVDLIEAIKLIQQNGMQVMAGFIVGFDNDTPDIFNTMPKFIQESGIVSAMVGVLQPLPQTRLWDRLEKEKRIYRASNGENKGEVHFEPTMGSEALEKGYKELLQNIYKPSKYYQRLNIFLKSYKPTAKGQLTKQDINALFISFWRIGILSNARFFYWYMIFKTLLLKKKTFPMCVELAIHGEHFRKSALEFLKRTEKKSVQQG